MLQTLIGGLCRLTTSMAATLTFGALTAAVATSSTAAWATPSAFVLRFLLSRRPTQPEMVPVIAHS